MLHIQYKKEPSERNKNIYFKIIENAGGGDCLFWTILEFLRREKPNTISFPENVNILRKTIVDSILQKWNKWYEEIVFNLSNHLKTVNEDRYSEYMIQPEIDGTNVELSAAAELFDFTVTIVRWDIEKSNIYNISCNDDTRRKKPNLFIIFNGSIHSGHYRFLELRKPKSITEYPNGKFKPLKKTKINNDSSISITNDFKKNTENSENEKSSTPCPHCKKLCKSESGVKIHISMAHPEEYMNSIAGKYQDKKSELETNNNPTENNNQIKNKELSEALKNINIEISEVEDELHKMLISKPDPIKLSDLVEGFANILVKSKEKLPGPKHPASKYYEARKRKLTFKKKDKNYSQSTNPERASKNEKARRKEKYNYELIQHLFHYSRKKAVHKILKASSKVESCKIPLSEIHKSFQERWSQSNDSVLEDYGPEINQEEQHEIDNNYTEDITEDEVDQATRGINLDTGSGLDGVSIKVIKKIKCFSTIAKIGSIMQKWNMVPELFKKARTILIHKKGPLNDVGNWRPISICSILRRIIERVIDRRLNGYIIEDENQVGFVHAPGTFINTSIINACLQKAKNEKLDCCIILLDVEKAFEETGHKHLKLKLSREKMPSKLRNIQISLFENNTTQIQTKKGLSEVIEVNKGVFQGVPTSPRMFNVSNDHVLKAVNETEISKEYGFTLHEDVPNVAGRGFADDLAVIGSSALNGAELTKIASTEFNKVGYKLNFGKCIAINIKNGVLVNEPIYIDDQNSIPSIEENEVIKYFRVTFNDEIVFQPDVIISKFNKDLQNLIGTSVLHPHQKLSIINQYLWPCLIYTLQSTPLEKIPKKFMDDLDKMVRATIKTIIGLPHDTPNAMLYSSKKYRGLPIIKPSWEAFVQHFNICVALLKCNDKYIPYTKNLELEMEKCIDELGLNMDEVMRNCSNKPKTKKSQVLREMLREEQFSVWCNHPSKGVGVECYGENKNGNVAIIDKKGLTTSEWINTLKMSCNVVPIKSIPGRSLNNNPLCRHCEERETLGHVLGYCHSSDLIRNNRHHDSRKILARHLRGQKWNVFEEVHCVSQDGSNRRVDIWCYKEEEKVGYIIDPTILMEKSLKQAEEVNLEKQSIYIPCVDYFKEKYKIDKIEVIGLLIGARGTITQHFENFRKKFKLSKELRTEIIISAIRGSCKIIQNHLYHQTIK